MEWFTRPSKATLYSIENATSVQGILREDHGIETVLKPIRRWRRPWPFSTHSNLQSAIICESDKDVTSAVDNRCIGLKL
jgi:hypothetical protein